jgi:ribosomal protein S27AE
LSLSVADEGDWFWVFDADQVVKDIPADYKARLEATEHDVAELEVFDTVAARAKQPDWPERFVMRSFFKAQKIRVVTNHITYMAEDGRLLWGYVTDEKPLAPALDLTDLVVEHRPDARPHERQVAKLGYYAERDNAKVERDKCSRCGEQAVQLVATKWRWSDLGPVAEWAEACEPCAKRLEKVGRMELTRMGVNPDGVSIENRNGRIPA